MQEGDERQAPDRHPVHETRRELTALRIHRVGRTPRRAARLAASLLALAGSLRALAAPDDVARLRRDVSYLASEELSGRRAGDRGADLAAAYAARALRQAGVHPLGRQGSYYQPFSFTRAVTRGERNLLLDPMAGGVELRSAADIEPLGCAADGGAWGPILCAGYGITAPEQGYDDYAGVDARGKVALVLHGEPRAASGVALSGTAHSLYGDPWSKAENASRQGAVALLIVGGPGEAVRLPDPARAIPFPDAGIPALYVTRAWARALLLHRGVSLDALEQRLDGGCPAPSAVPGAPLYVQSELRRERARTSNVVGYLGGTADGDAVIVGAHYDHVGRGGRGSLDPSARGRVHPGADDNASGTAAVLALAARLAPEEARLRRRVIFALFSAEEEGLWGSARYVEEPPHPLERTRAMINLDMVGRLDGEKLLVAGAGSAVEWRSLVRDASTGLPLHCLFATDASAPSDHVPFYQRRLPVLFLFTGMHADYHRTSDVSSRINYEGEGAVVTLLTRLVETIARDRAPITFRISPPAPDDRIALSAMGLDRGEPDPASSAMVGSFAGP